MLDPDAAGIVRLSDSAEITISALTLVALTLLSIIEYRVITNALGVTLRSGPLDFT